MKEYSKTAKNMLEFIEQSPTCFQAVANMKQKLAQAGFRELKETEDWRLDEGTGYYVTRNDSSIIAFSLPDAADTVQEEKRSRSASTSATSCPWPSW